LRTCLHISDAEIGMAGIKDKQAVTSQRISLPLAVEPSISSIEVPGVEILATGRHQNKLRMGHLLANRFRILLRTEDANGFETARAICNSINETGIVNTYGEQRFGGAGRNAEAGRNIIAQGKPARMSRRRIQFLLSAWQSEQF